MGFAMTVVGFLELIGVILAVMLVRTAFEERDAAALDLQEAENARDVAKAHAELAQEDRLEAEEALTAVKKLRAERIDKAVKERAKENGRKGAAKRWNKSAPKS